MIQEALKKVAAGQDLTYDEAYASMDEIFSGQVPGETTAGYLTALHMKGETLDEITASANGMRDHAESLPHDGIDVLEIVGTGGDCANSFNISTTSGIVAAAAGVPIAKHGNRSVSSKSGAADVLEALGVNISISPEKMGKVLAECDEICRSGQKGTWNTDSIQYPWTSHQPGKGSDADHGSIQGGAC